MAALVPQARPEPATGLILSGDPVLSGTWTEMALLANYLRGTGASLFPACFPEDPVAKTTTGTYRFRVKPRDSAIERIWILWISATVSGASVIIRAPASSGTPSASLSVGTDPDVPNTIYYTETLGAKSGTEAEVTIDVQGSTQDVVVNSIECYEQTRPILTLDTTDYGVDLVTLRPRGPIYDVANATPAGVMDSYDNADARRVGGLAWVVDSATPVTSSTSTFAGWGSLLALDMPVIGRVIVQGQTGMTWTWSVYAKVDAGATGEVEIIDGNGDNLDTITVTSTAAFAWVTASTFSTDAEDLSLADGIRGGAWQDGTVINARMRWATGTAGSVHLAGLCVWDANTS